MNGERYIGVALDYSPSSKYALKWTIDNILRPNDHLIVVVVNKDFHLEGGTAVLWEKTGSRKFLPPLLSCNSQLVALHLITLFRCDILLE